MRNADAVYDAETRLVSVSGPGVSASFVPDGDGNWVQSTLGGAMTTFVGNYYEVSGGALHYPDLASTWACNGNAIAVEK